MNLLVLFFVVTISLLSSSIIVAASHNKKDDRFRRKDRELTYGDTTKEQILETRNRRRRQLNNMILDARKKLADHAAGEITLTQEKKKAMENQMDIFQRKLDTMKEELEDWVRL
jgi:mannitol-specific phosphotransferase system IIBC component